MKNSASSQSRRGTVLAGCNEWWFRDGIILYYSKCSNKSCGSGCTILLQVEDHSNWSSVLSSSSITDEGPILLNILQIFFHNMLFSPMSLPSSLLFCWAKPAPVWTLKWHHIPNTHLVHLAGDITEGLVCFFSFHISIHYHCPPLQIQDTLIVPLLVLQRRYTWHHFSTTQSFLLLNSVLLPLQFSTFYQGTYCASSVLLSLPVSANSMLYARALHAASMYER